MSSRARDYNDSATGARSNPATQSGPPETSEQLQKIGIAANPPAAAQLPDLSTQIGPWMQTNVRFKVEGGQMTTQLGQGPGINIFNQNMIQFEKVR